MFVEKAKINEYYQQLFHKDFPASTLAKWKKEGKITTINHPTISNRFLYNLEDFKNIVNNEKYSKIIKAKKEKPENYIGKTSGSLLITGIVPNNEKRSNYSGTMMYCKCLKCNRKDLVQVKFSYLTPNGNYHQTSCGCARKERAFLASCRDGIKEEFLNNFDNFEYFLLVHKLLMSTTDKYYITCDIKEYEKAILYFYNNEQLKIIYNFWKNQNKESTYYDWAKPSLDHIIPKSRGGTNKLDNLQILTVFENLAKRDMTWNEWINFQKTTNTHSNYFLNSIKGGD